MLDFYRIDFAKKRSWWWVWVLLVLVLLSAGGVVGRMWALESQQPVLQVRLSKYQQLYEQLCSVHTLWKRSIAGFKIVEPYVHKNHEVSPMEMVRVFTALKGELKNGDPDLCYAFIPGKVSIIRNESVHIDGYVKLPERDRLEHCDAVYKALNCAFSNAYEKVKLPEGSTWEWAWSQGEPDIQDTTRNISLDVILPENQGAIKHPPVPEEIKPLLDNAQNLHKKVWNTNLKFKSDNLKRFKTVDKALDSLIGMQSLKLKSSGDYARATNLYAAAVNPLDVTSLLKESAVDPENSSVKEFDDVWSALSSKNWLRKRNLDNPRLDAEISSLETVVKALPRKKFFEMNIQKNTDIFHSLTNGIHRKHIASETTFWDDVLEPSFEISSRKDLKPALKDTMKVSGKADTVKFPEWRIGYGSASDESENNQSGGGGISMPELLEVLLNVETNSVGTWLTGVQFSFDKTEQGRSAWNSVSGVEIAGRVPCWMKE